MAVVAFESFDSGHVQEASPQLKQHGNAGAARGLVTASILSLALWVMVLIAAISLF